MQTTVQQQPSYNTLSDIQLTLVQGGNLEAPMPNNYDQRSLQYAPWRDEQHVNSVSSSRHTGYASKFNAMN